MLRLLLSTLVAPESVWVEAEWFSPLRGANFSFMAEGRQTSGSWSLAGPDVAAAWTQGGESEFLSIAARADEPLGTSVSRSVQTPVAGRYRLWVRYADYRKKQETFAVSIKQGTIEQSHRFGEGSIVDELDPMSLLWGWSYAWDSVEVELSASPAQVTISTTGPTEARRCVDCLCLTTDWSYKPSGREKPAFRSWDALEQMRRDGLTAVEPFVAHTQALDTTKVIEPPAFLWNVGAQWSAELTKASRDQVGAPFAVDPPLLADFLSAFRGRVPELYGSQLSGPVWHVPNYPSVFADGSDFMKWLDQHPKARFAILLNYGEPQWSEGSDRQRVHANLVRYRAQFVGFIAGENVAYASIDQTALDDRIQKAESRGEVLAALKEAHTKAVVSKFGDYAGRPVSPNEAWADVVSCLSANNEAYCHALAAWGVKRIGHENTGNSPTLARRLAFLRGAARQFGCKLIDYQSANLGDSATMFSREAYFYPASSRYVLDNSYDAWAGAGTNWLLKDYLLWYLAGVDAFYNEQGVDMYWKPGGGAAGDDFPVQLSPKGKVALTVQDLVANHPRPEQYTPVAFLLDEAHGWSQERFQPGAFGLDPVLNPPVLAPGRHEAAIRGWFDVAYYPAPLTQNEPATAIRQTYVNGLFGDIFDVLVTAPRAAEGLRDYAVVIAAGEVGLSREWSSALERYVREGGTLVVSTDQLDGLPKALTATMGPEQYESGAYRWLDGDVTSCARFGHRPLYGDRTLASSDSGRSVVVLDKVGRGQVVTVGVPLGLGVDERPVPFLGPLLHHLTQGLTPVKVRGDVEWVLGKLPDGAWLVALFNNRGIVKPQHGVLPTDHGQNVKVKIDANADIVRAEEWMTGLKLKASGKELSVNVPAGAVRLVALYEK